MARIASLADIEAIEGTPLAQRDLPRNTFELLERGAASVAHDKPALHFFVRGTEYQRAVTIGYGDLLGSIRQTANLLHELGVGARDVTSILLPNLPETFFALFGAEAAGIANPINPLLEPEVIAEIMNAAGTKVLVTLAPIPRADIWQKVEAIRAGVPTLETILRVDLARYLPWRLRVLLGAARMAAPEPGSVVGQRVLDFDAVRRRLPADHLGSGRTIEPDEIASYFHTGGTTGTPKLAQHTHRNEVFDAWALAEVLDSHAGQTSFCGLPLFHVNGVTITGLTPFSRGGAVVLGSPQGYRGEGVISNFWKIVEHFGVTAFSGVPTVYSALLEVPIGEARVDSLEYGGCGAAAMPPELFRQFVETSGIPILEGYGLTEGACVSSINPLYGERRVGSIGLRLPYQQMKTVLLDGQGRYLRDCQVNEIGALVIRGPNVFPGYRQAQHDRGLWIDDGDGAGGWMNTGDLGRVDAASYIWLTGRRKELIIRGGHNIDPALIEEPLVAHPAVALAAAVGRPDPKLGELPVAYVQLRPEASATEAELLEYARDTIGERAAIPKAVRVVDELPLTAVGKIFKPRLRWAEIESVFQREVADVPGVEDAVVQAGPDAVHGESVRVQLQLDPDADAQQVRVEASRRLGRYPVAYELMGR